MATYSSVLAWRIPGTGEPGGLPSMGSHRVGHDWCDLAAAANYFLGFLMYGSFKLLMNSWLSLCGRLLTIFYCVKAFSNLCNLRIKNTERLQWKGGIRSPFSTLYTPIKVILFLMHPSRISLCIYKQMQIYIFLSSSPLCLLNFCTFFSLPCSVYTLLHLLCVNIFCRLSQISTYKASLFFFFFFLFKESAYHIVGVAAI